MSLRAPLTIVALALFSPREASATFSVLAHDRDTGTFVGAVASCVPLETVEEVYGVTPAGSGARGAVLTQSYLLPGANGNAVGALAEGLGADAVLGALLDPAYDDSASLRQYAVADDAGGFAAFTGSASLPVATHRTFLAGSIVGSAQGNILAEVGVIDAASEAFISAEHCGVAERALRALEAASFAGGDARCADLDKRALSATLDVDPPSGAPLRLAFDTAEEDPADPIALLRAAFDEARADACEPPAVEPPPDGPPDDGGETAPGVDDACSTSSPGNAPPGALFASLAALVLATSRARRRRGSSRHSRRRAPCCRDRAHR